MIHNCVVISLLNIKCHTIQLSINRHIHVMAIPYTVYEKDRANYFDNTCYIFMGRRAIFIIAFQRVQTTIIYKNFFCVTCMSMHCICI